MIHEQRHGQTVLLANPLIRDTVIADMDRDDDEVVVQMVADSS